MNERGKYVADALLMAKELSKKLRTPVMWNGRREQVVAGGKYLCTFEWKGGECMCAQDTIASGMNGLRVFLL